MNFNPAALDADVKNRYREAMSPEQCTVRMVLERMEPQAQSLSPSMFDAISRKHGIAKARFLQVIQEDEGNVGTNLTCFPQHIEHHAVCALTEILLPWGRDMRMIEWRGCPLKQVKKIVGTLPIRLRERLDVVFEIAAQEIDPTKQFEQAFARWEMAFNQAIIAVDLRFLFEQRGSKARLRAMQIEAYETVLDEYRQLLLQWFQTVKDHLCNGGFDSRWDRIRGL